MSWLKLLVTGIVRLGPVIYDLYRTHQAKRQQAENQQKEQQINENPNQNFANEFGDSSGSVRITATSPDELPADRRQP